MSNGTTPNISDKGRFPAWLTVELAASTVVSMFLMGMGWQALASDISRNSEISKVTVSTVKQITADLRKTSELIWALEKKSGQSEVHFKNVQDSIKRIDVTQTRILMILERRYKNG
jgi:hypothetical protein